MEDRGVKTTKNPNLTLRQETFLQAYRRLGIGPFKAALYETDAQDAA
jgi:hypothetical protein